jgi:hypothetical protein
LYATTSDWLMTADPPFAFAREFHRYDRYEPRVSFLLQFLWYFVRIVAGISLALRIPRDSQLLEELPD